MQYINYYQSPVGKIVLTSDGSCLSGLWFEGQKYSESYISVDIKECDIGIFKSAKRWLDIYFSGAEPSFSLPLRFDGTDFQERASCCAMRA